jgi:hypothetical protein
MNSWEVATCFINCHGAEDDCTIRYRPTSVSQWPAAYSVRVEEATFIRRLNLNFCRSPTVTNMKWQKGETGYVGEVTVDNLTGNRLQAVPPVYCSILSQWVILSVTEISLTFCTRNMTEYGSRMKRGLSEPWWSQCLLMVGCYGNAGTHSFRWMYEGKSKIIRTFAITHL